MCKIPEASFQDVSEEDAPRWYSGSTNDSSEVLHGARLHDSLDQYIKLAIGNAPWPIGVTMVGIHKHSAHEKIYPNSVAHIMNDETTRKYLQSIKRLMTLCQWWYPSMPSKSVELNSLANMSDLHSLLLEESVKTGSHATEEWLLLMAAKEDNENP
jgi:pre-mRNA-splicing factor 18